MCHAHSLESKTVPSVFLWSTDEVTPIVTVGDSLLHEIMIELGIEIDKLVDSIILHGAVIVTANEVAVFQVIKHGGKMPIVGYL